MNRYVFGHTETIVRKYEVLAQDFQDARRKFRSGFVDDDVTEISKEVVKSEWWCDNNSRTD